MLELLVVVGILAALVALALPFYQDYVNQSKLTAAEADLQTFKKALAMYDQLEPEVYTSGDLKSLIGRYLQDFRTSADQVAPVDPWGSDYKFDIQTGAIWSPGPNRREESANARIAAGDDILVTWKPPFIVSSAQALNDTTIEITFSRKVEDLVNAASTYVTMTPDATGNMIKISDTAYRFKLSASLVAGNYTILVAGISAQDGSTTFDTRPEDATPGGTVKFTY